MLRLSRFTYVRARSLEHAFDVLQTHGDGVALMAGGTDLLVNIKHRLTTPEVIVGIRDVPELQHREVAAEGSVTLGAGTTLLTIESDPAVMARFPALAHAAHLISTPQVRATATLGGNICLDTRCNYYNQSFEWRRAIGFCMKKDSEICRVAPGGDRCWAVASADTVPVLIALRAEVDVAGPSGLRRVPLESLYVDDGLVPLTLLRGEIVQRVHIPPPDGWTCVYRKFRIRQSFDFPLVGIATALRTGAEGMVLGARIVTTAVASYPERARKAESALVGRPLDEEAVAAAGDAVYRTAKPMDNTAGSIFHRKRMARVLVERSLREIAGLPDPVRAAS